MLTTLFVAGVLLVPAVLCTGVAITFFAEDSYKDA